MKDLIGQSSYNIPVCSIQLSPYLLKQHYPDLPSASWLGKQRLSLFINWHIIIHNYLSQHSLIEHTGHIDAVLVDFQAGENILDPEVILCNGRNGTEEVAISYAALQDVSWLDLATHELCVFDDIGNAFPGGLDLQVFYVPQGALIRWELGISKLLPAFGVFLDELGVVGLEHLLDDPVLSTHQQIFEDRVACDQTLGRSVVDELAKVQSAMLSPDEGTHCSDEAIALGEFGDECGEIAEDATDGGYFVEDFVCVISALGDVGAEATGVEEGKHANKVISLLVQIKQPLLPNIFYSWE